MLSNFENKLKNEINSNNNDIEDLKNLFSILNDKNELNEKKTKILKKEKYISLIKLIIKGNKQQFFNFLNYFNGMNIPIEKIIINGFINFDLDNYEKNILEIIEEITDIFFSKNLIYFVYKKFSKIYRRHDLINLSFPSFIKKFSKLISIWKFLYNPQKEVNIQNLENPNFIFLSDLKEDNKSIEINIKDANKMRAFTIIINFAISEILNLNKLSENLCFIKLYDNKNKLIEIKPNDIGLFDKIDSFSKIIQIKLILYKLKYYIIINDKEKTIEKNSNKFDFNSITKVEMLNNFFGGVSSIIIEKEYSSNSKKNRKFRIELEKDISFDKIKIISNDSIKEINEKDVFEKNKIRLFKYYGILFDIKFNCRNDINNWNHINKDLDNIIYYGGLNCFIPLFKIIKYMIDSILENFSSNQNNNNDEKEKLTEINNYLNKLIIIIKDILKLIIRLICYSENNFKNFEIILIPLIGALSEIFHSLNNLPLEKINYFHDEIFHSLFIIIMLTSNSLNIKKIYQKIIGINDNLDNLICSIDSIIFDIEKNNFKNLDWYFIILMICLEFFMIYYNSSSKVPIQLMNQLENIISFQNKGKEKDDKIKVITMKLLFEPIKKFYKGKRSDSVLYSENILVKIEYYLKYIVHILKAFLNIKKVSLSNNYDLNTNKFYIIFLNFFLETINERMIRDIKNNQEIIKIINANVNCFPEENSFLKQLFPFLTKENLISSNELLMNELIDFHQKYHHLMKELFIFNRLWSDQKKFFFDSLIKRKESNIKYKNINYYTRNFQRPIMYPVLDYKYRYPDFYCFKINDNFYNVKESKDDYNFDLDCPELDKLVEEYNDKIFSEIEKNGKINVYYCCYIKQLYHIKGKLFIVHNDNDKKFLMYFYSFPYNIQIEKDKLNCCNKEIDEENKDNNDFAYLRDYKNYLCYGSLFNCNKKEENRIIKIDLNDVRMIVRRIYYYRKSAIEIFTQTKSYYFNFHSEDKIDYLFLSLIYPCEQSFFPININDSTIGYLRVNNSMIEEDNLNNLVDKKRHGFIEFISNKTSMGQLCEMCVFDIIMLINLISNRSYIDLHQYPIFPILYFFDKTNEVIKRDFKQHIGFQDVTDNLKERKNLFLISYRESLNNISEFSETDEAEINAHCFNTHFSNIVYTSNYMLRVFPYSFAAIEMQGSGFDNPNRLFHHITDTLYNITLQKSDLRELIPEFFYLPEIFMNINSINFQKNSENELVDDVIINNTMSEINNETNLKGKDNYEKIFIFVEDMKTQLEYLEQNMCSWINLIFGTQQKYDIIDKKQYFRTESYIEQEGVDYQQYVKNELIMSSCDFGVMPLQTIFENKILENFKNRKNTYENIEGIYNEDNEQNLLNQNNSLSDDSEKPINKQKNGEIIKEELTPKITSIIDNLYELEEFEEDDLKKENIKIESAKSSVKKPKFAKKYEMNDNYLNDQFWDEQLDINFKINNTYNFGKLEIYSNNFLIYEIIDHNDKINDFFFNKRLNMFCTSSSDGLACIYILPKKLFSVIKNSNKSYFDKVFLCSNPFPAIITFEKKNNLLSSYSLSGLLIKQKKVEIPMDEKIEISPILNIYGGNKKDQVKVSIKTDLRIINQIYSLPLLVQESEEILIKEKIIK